MYFLTLLVYYNTLYQSFYSTLNVYRKPQPVSFSNSINRKVIPALFHQTLLALSTAITYSNDPRLSSSLEEVLSQSEFRPNSTKIHFVPLRQTSLQRHKTKFCHRGFKFPNVCQNILKPVRRRLNQFIIQVLGDTSATSMFTHMYVCKSRVRCFFKKPYGKL